MPRGCACRTVLLGRKVYRWVVQGQGLLRAQPGKYTINNIQGGEYVMCSTKPPPPSVRQIVLLRFLKLYKNFIFLLRNKLKLNLPLDVEQP